MIRYRLWIIVFVFFTAAIAAGIYLYPSGTVLKPKSVVPQSEDPLVLARELLYEGKTKEAEEALKKILSTDHRNIKALSTLGTLYYRQGNMEMAYQYWREALKISPDDKIIGGLVKALERDKLQSGSLYHMEIQTVDHAQSWEKHFTNGQNLYLKGNYKAAVEELKKAKELKQDDSKIYFVLGAAYLKINDRENTISMWETALRLNPEDKMVRELLNKVKNRKSLSVKPENISR